jgi:hypothetical protein
MKHPTLFALVASALAIGFSPTAPAVQLQDGRTYFTSPPQLQNFVTTERRTLANASYYLTLTLPENAGEPLQKVTITQKDGSTRSRQVRFENSQAFEGTRRDRGADLPVAATNFDVDTQTVEVVFDPPVTPGKTVTIELEPDRNPRRDGVYLFGVTAFPPGDSAYGQFLGYGRLHFDGGDNVLPFF